MKRAAEPRSISPHEAAIVEWLLDNAAVRDVSAYRAKPISSLHVVGGCDCGCSSLFFADDHEDHRKGHPDMLADALAVYPDKQKCGLILWGRGQEIVWLEVYEMNLVADRVPEIADLQPF
jgi:hypothetical protein